MSTTHPINYTTEWDEAQIKFGNYKPYVEEPKQIALSLEAQNRVAACDLSKLANRFDDESNRTDSDTDVYSDYRARRLSKLKEQIRRNCFGTAVEVCRQNYVAEVTNASKDARVLCLLYEKTNELNLCARDLFAALAREFPAVKFCVAESLLVVERFPPSQLPCILVYQRGALQTQHSLTALANKPKLDAAALKDHLLALHLLVQSADSSDAGDSQVDSDNESTRPHDNTAARSKGYMDTEMDRVMRFVLK